MTHLQHLRLLATLFVSILVLSTTVSAQQTPPEIEWQKSLGGSGSDVAASIAQTSDGGYIVAGYSRSTNGDVTSHFGSSYYADCWVVKLTSTGNIQWQKSLGGSRWDEACFIAQTSDDGYIVAVRSESTDGDVTGHHGSDNTDYWVVKLTSMGDIQWQKSLGGSSTDWVTSIAQTSDDGYIVAGHSESTDGDVTGSHGRNDYWIVKLTSMGDIQWQKSLGGSSQDGANCITPTSDGGYIVAGLSFSIDGDVTGRHGSDNTDCWVVKLTSMGDIQWQKSFGGSGSDSPNSIAPTSDGGYIVAGYSYSIDGDVTGHHGSSEYLDCWVVKLTNTGQIEWQKSLGGSRDDGATSITQTIDGGYIVAGTSLSTDGDITSNHGASDYWIVKLTSMGIIEWQKSLGGRDEDLAACIAQTIEGGYIVAGASYSTDGDVRDHHGSSEYSDYWIVKLAPATSDVNLQPEPATNLSTISVLPNPAQNTTVLKITSTAEAEYTIELVSSIGSVVKRQSLHLGIGEQEVQLRDIGLLPAGSYEVIVSRSKTPVAHGRVVVVGQ